MNNIYKVDLNKIRQESLAEVFSFLEDQLSKLDINFYLIGAVAKDMWMTGIYDMVLGRITTDLDLAVLVEDQRQYEKLKENLVNTGRFYALKENKYTLLFDHRIQIDLLPFEGLNLGGLGFTHVIALTNITNGLAEVHNNGTVKVEVQGQQFAVSTLPSIVLLKLISYDDRPENRGKDLLDIANIIKQYDRIAGEELFEEEFLDLLNLENAIVISARLMGRHIYSIIKNSSNLVERVLRILTKYHLYLDNVKTDFGSESQTDILKEIRAGLGAD